MSRSTTVGTATAATIMAITCALHLARQAPTSAQGAWDGASQHAQAEPLADFCACMAFMQSLMASSETVLTTASVPMLARICMAAQAELTGASDRDRAIKIAKMTRRRCKVMGPFRNEFIMNGLTDPSRHDCVTVRKSTRNKHAE